MSSEIPLLMGVILDGYAILLMSVGLIAASPIIIKGAIAIGITIKEKMKEKRPSKNLAKSRRITNKTPEQMFRKNTVRRSVGFYKTTTNDRSKEVPKNIQVSEEAAFDITKDILLKGRMYVTLEDGSVINDPIYMFQPRAFVDERTCLGPFKDSKGNLPKNKAYVAKVGNEFYCANIPKREVCSGRAYDFVTNDGVPPRDSELASYVKINLEQTPTGEFKPVDLNDEKEKQLFDDYCAYYQKHDAAAAFDARVGFGENTLIQRKKKMHRDDVSRERDYQDSLRREQKVTDSRQPRDEANEYYRRYRRARQREYFHDNLDIRPDMPMPPMGGGHRHGGHRR